MTRLVALMLAAAGTVAVAQDTRPTSRPAQGEDVAEPVTSKGGLTFTAQEGWKQETEQRPMRVVTYVLPKVEGDDEDATVVVYHFPGSGGSVEDNLKRWYGQWSQPDGKNSADVAETKKVQLASAVSAAALTVAALPGVSPFPQLLGCARC